MPELTPAAACEIISAARAFHAKDAVSFDDGPAPDDEWASSAVAEHHDDLDYQNLKTLIEDLDRSQQVSLVALMWLGRGDYEDFASAAEDAARAWNPRTADYLIATPLVANYLEEGLARSGYSCES